MAMCRVCLIGDTDIKLVDLSRIYQEVYQKLTNTELHTGTEYGMPSTVCYVCHRLLQRCHMFSEMARTSNRILRDLLYNGIEVTHNALKMQPQNGILKLSLTQTLHLSLSGLTDASSTPVLVKDEQILEYKEEREEETLEHKEIDIEELKLESVIDVNGNDDSNETDTSSTPVAVKDERILEFKEGREDETPEHEEIVIEEFKLESLIDGNVNDDSNATDTIRKSSSNDVNYMHSCFICDVCNKIFHKRENLVKHLKIHTKVKSYSCDRCDKRFNKSSNLKVHMRIHTGEKPYSCNGCEKTFVQKCNLITHMRTHTGEKPYSCHRCNMKFIDKRTLTTHMQIHIGEKPFSCNRCEKTFVQKCNLIAHMRIHTGEKPYSCHRCDMTFINKHTLATHMHIHTGEKPFSCNRCEKTFVQKCNLIAHMRIHTREKPYPFHRCDTTFLYNSTL